MTKAQMDIVIKELDACMQPEERERLLADIAGLDEKVFGSSRWGAEAFAENVTNDYDDLLAACEKDSGRLLGYGLIRSFDSAEVIMIAADEVYRRQGIGRRILEGLRRKAEEKGAGEIFLEVRAGNTAARGLYRGAGFTEAGLRRGYYHDPVEDAVIMRLDL